jgi:hypothetical protein
MGRADGQVHAFGSAQLLAGWARRRAAADGAGGASTSGLSLIALGATRGDEDRKASDEKKHVSFHFGSLRRGVPPDTAFRAAKYSDAVP